MSTHGASETLFWVMKSELEWWQSTEATRPKNITACRCIIDAVQCKIAILNETTELELEHANVVIWSNQSKGFIKHCQEAQHILELRAFAK